MLINIIIKKMKKNIINHLKVLFIVIALLVAIISIVFVLSSCKNSSPVASKTENSSASISSGDSQIIEVTVRGGYSPRKIDAKAGVPTILRMISDGAYGCETAFYIPKLGISMMLPSSGNTDIDLGSQDKGTRLTGVCSMGMYSFVINFN